MRRSRRTVLARAGATGALALAGCTTLGTDSEPVRVLVAGSLQRAVDRGLRDAVDDPIRVEARGSAAAARLVADGQRDPDVLALADIALFSRLLGDAWYASFATNAICVATADTHGGRAVQAAAGERATRDAQATADAHWYDPIIADDATLGRTDPALDPLGYRTLFVLDLLAAANDDPELSEHVLAPDQVYPETALLSQLELGAVDAAVVYESMATDHGYDAIDLPATVDLSDPAHADTYSRASYDLPDGGRIRGDVIAYGTTLRSLDDPAARRVFDALVDGSVLDAHGFGTPAHYPAYSPNAPRDLVTT
jgi:molybdate/tungstate transport system substrate-binding protein